MVSQSLDKAVFLRKPIAVVSGHCKRRKSKLLHMIDCRATISARLSSQHSTQSSSCTSHRRSTPLLRPTSKVRTMSFTQISIALLFSVLLLLLQSHNSFGQVQCPEACQCNWISGKTTARCNQAQLISVPKGFPNYIQVLYLEDNNLQVLPSRVFEEHGLTSLQKIFLARSKLGQIRSDAFHRLTNLIELDLSDNLLTEVPSDALTQLPFLRRLRLSGNPLRRIRSRAFASVPQLNYLNLSSAQLDTLEPDCFEGLNKLQYLMLDGNRLTTLGEQVFSRLPPLYSLQLNGNPWNCDCEMRPARQWLANNNIHLGVHPLCAAPAQLAGRALDQLSVEQFACMPVMLPTDRNPAAVQGSTALLKCQVRTVAESILHWRVQLDNGSWLLVSESMAFDQNSLEGPNNNLMISGLSSPNAIQTSSSHQHLPLDGRLQLQAPSPSYDDEHVLTTQLRLRNASLFDSGRRFMCTATNEAGSANLNYTLQVQTGAVAGAAGAVAAVSSSGGLFWLLLLLMVATVVVVGVAYAANRRLFCFRANDLGDEEASSMNKSALPSLDVLKHVGNGTGNHPGGDCINGGPASAALLNGDSIEKRSMNAPLPSAKQLENTSSGYGSNGVTPDLTSCVLKMQHSASYAQLASNVGTIGCPPTDLSGNPIHDYSYLQQSTLVAGQHPADTYGYLQQSNPSDFTQYLQPIEASHGYVAQANAYHQPSHFVHPSSVAGHHLTVNYENMYEAQGAFTSQSMLVGGGLNEGNPTVYTGQSSSYSHPITSGDQVGYSMDGGPMYWSNNGSTSKQALDQPSGSASLNGTNGSGHVNLLPQPAYLAAQPTVVRYSPDEGYAEETANTPFTLEGTEV